ncbi:MAG: hypothetical protein JHC84_10330 [Solirubrobacteraceae bacterium]|nr:hypothetical protein [Solirubrobacteraceae bacterium]
MASHRPGRYGAGFIAALIAVVIAAPVVHAADPALTTIAPDGHVAGESSVDSTADAAQAVVDSVQGEPAATAGALRGTGDNVDGELGVGKRGSETNFAITGTEMDWTSAAAGDDFTCAIRAPGTLWCWGENGLGQLGLGDRTDLQVPARIGTAATWTSVTAGRSHACATQSNGTLWCWGEGSYGKLGLNSVTTFATPQRVAGTGWKAASATIDSTCAVKTDGTLWCWGYNGSGQLGQGDVTSERTPQRVGTAATWDTVSSGGYHTCATQTNRSLWCWGDNNLGEAGVGNVTKQKSPARVGTTNDWSAVSAAFDSTCAIRTNGTLWCWGYNGSGELGLGHTLNQRAPQQVGVDATWASLAAGRYSTCAIKADTTLWCWGYNAIGQLGHGDTARRTAPTQVVTPVTAIAVAPGAAADHTMVVTGDTTPVDACPEQPLAQSFASLGDLAEYSLAPAGDFESSVEHWSLKHAAVVAGNEDVGIMPGAQSLRLGGLGSVGTPEVVSPPFCINETNPHFRFLLKSAATTNNLYTSIRFRPRFNPSYVVELTSETAPGAAGSWRASGIHPLATRIAESLIAKGGTVQLVFRTTASANSRGGVQIDNVLVDPYRRR